MAESPQTSRNGARQQTPMHWYTLTEAAKLLGISEAAVRRRIRDRSLTALRAGRGWRILLPGQPRTVEKEIAPAAAEPVAAPATDSGSLAVLVRELQRQNLALAGQIGFLQSQLSSARDEAKLLAQQKSDTVEHEPSAVSRVEHDAALAANTALRQKLEEITQARPNSQPEPQRRRRWWPWGRE